MLKENSMVVIHPIFGRIRLEDKFLKVLEMPSFRELNFKSQLGTKVLSKTCLNAKHSRLMHSIGVMHLTNILLDTCEKKFSGYFEITKQEREILQLAALGHDVGHIAFSHSLEEPEIKTHEKRTIEIFEENAEKINTIFGYDITSEVISIYKNNINVKKQGVKAKMNDKLDILFIFTSLLIGTIDCDRMEYLMTDKYMVLGENTDFRDIFPYITIILLNDFPMVGFEKEAVPIIENLLITRFDQYSYIYYEEDATLLEMALTKYKKVANWTQEYKETVSEYEISSELKAVLRDEAKANTVQYRLADIILNGNRANILCKKFDNDKEYNHFLERIYSITGRKDIVLTCTKKVKIYDPKKNKVFIKDSDGVVKDIMEVSLKIREFSINFGYVMVDLDSIYKVNPKEEKDLRELFEGNPVEIEKKFIFPEMPSLVESNYYATCKTVENILKCSCKCKEIQWERVQNEDIYYEPLCKISCDVAMRKRKTHDVESYFIKIPTDDGTSITKRKEYQYNNCKSLEEFLCLATSLFDSQGIQFEGELKVREGVKITTKRFKTLIHINENSIIEVACDFSKYEYNGKIAYGKMLECEKKQGDDLSLWYLTKFLVQAGFIETNESKQTKAKKALEIK